jgi:hypothetical protein
MSFSVLRLLFLVSLCAMAGALVSCETETVGPDGNIFLRRSPRYGHGGTENPRYKYGATGDERTDPEARSRRETRYLDREEQRRRDEGRDPGQDERGSAAPTSDAADNPSSTADQRGSESNTGSSPETSDEPKPKSKPASEDLPYATPVPGKDGFVYSPYYSAGYVDVSGMPSGSKARCPYTKKIFRVP